MRERPYRLACSSAMRLGALLMLLHTSANAQDSADLERCASLEDPQARLECYDTASRRQRDSRAPAANPDPDDSREPGQPVPLSDAVGEEQIETKDVKEGPVRGTLTECRQGPTGKWFFYFDNGQVWEQRDNDRLRLGECDFEVTILKDFFGYKMEMPDSRNKVRIGRVK